MRSFRRRGLQFPAGGRACIPRTAISRGRARLRGGFRELRLGVTGPIALLLPLAGAAVADAIPPGGEAGGRWSAAFLQYRESRQKAGNSPAHRPCSPATAALAAQTWHSSLTRNSAHSTLRHSQATITRRRLATCGPAMASGRKLHILQWVGGNCPPLFKVRNPAARQLMPCDGAAAGACCPVDGARSAAMR